MPPPAEQGQIVSEVERLLSVADEAARTVEREAARAGRLRQSILKEAFAGRLVEPSGSETGNGVMPGRAQAAARAGNEQTELPL